MMLFLDLHCLFLLGVSVYICVGGFLSVLMHKSLWNVQRKVAVTSQLLKGRRERSTVIFGV